MKSRSGTGLAALTGLLLVGTLWMAWPHGKIEPTGSVPVASATGVKNQVADWSDPDSTTARALIAEPVAGQSLTGASNVVVSNEAEWARLEKGVTLREIPNALRFLQTQPDSDRVRDMMLKLIQQWAESAAPAAAKWVQEMLKGEAREQALNAVAIAWTQQEQAAALRWVRQLKEAGERNRIATSMGYQVAMTDPVTALNLAVELPASTQRDELVKYGAMQWAIIDPAAAALWADGIGDDVLRDRVLANIATAWSERDPVRAAKLALQSIPPGREQDDAVIGIVQQWAQKDPQAALNWVRKFPAGTLEQIAMENIRKLTGSGIPPVPADNRDQDPLD